MNWIPCTWREPSEDEAQAQKEQYGETFPIATFQVPEDGQEILITKQWWNKEENRMKRYTTHDTAGIDCGMLFLEDHDDFENVIAWMPLPEPYKEEK